MKKAPLFVLPLLFVALFTLTALGDGLIIPEHPDRGWLTVTYHRVTVTIEDGIVTTHVDQEFRNDTTFPIEGEYVFPLPEGAVVSDFSMWADGERLEGRILDADEARSIYEDYVRRALDPALLEYIGRDTLSARVFPIPPGGRRRIELSYTEALTAEFGVYLYRYPLDTERFSAAPLDEVKIDVTIRTTPPLQAVYSPTHRIDIERGGERAATVHYSEQGILPTKDFILYYSVLPEEMGMTLLTYKAGDDDGFFLVIFSPPPVAEEFPIPKDLVFVLDTSGSMSGEKLEEAKAALRFILDNLAPDDRFAIVAFSDYLRAEGDRLIPVTEDAVAGAIAWVGGLDANGGTNIDDALTAAISLFEDDVRPHYLIFLTDGQPTVGITDPASIIADVNGANTADARLFAFGVGYDVNTLLLDRLTVENHGTTVYVTPGENLERALSSFYTKISSPVLSSPAVRINGVSVYDTYPNRLPDIFRGSQLLYVGRYEGGGEATISLTGDVSGSTVSFTADRTFPDVDLADEFLPRLWAGRKIAYLLDQIRLYGEDEELIDTVIELSKRYGIITPYTSFLVEEGGLTADEMAYRLGQSAAAAPSSGKQAVTGAASIQALAEDEVAPSEDEAVRVVGDRTFFLRDDVWTESTYSDEETIQVLAYSEAYFDILVLRPDLSPILALGNRVIFRLEAAYVEIGPEGADTLTDELRDLVEG